MARTQSLGLLIEKSAFADQILETCTKRFKSLALQHADWVIIESCFINQIAELRLWR